MTPPRQRIDLISGVTDMRKSIDGLALIVTDTLELDPMSEAWFIFCNRGRDKLKSLFGGTSGFLKQHGRLDFWINDDLIDHWYHADRVFNGTGSSQVYTDLAILICHEIRVTFKRPLRQTQGFIDSLFEMTGLPLKCPDYTVLSKRLSQLNIKAPRYLKQPEPEDESVAIAIDSTGLKRCGRDE